MSEPSTEDLATFGAMLKYLRRRARLTQRELGIAVGYSEGQINRLEGDSRLPSPVMVRAVFIEALGLHSEPGLARRLLALAEASRDKRLGRTSFAGAGEGRPDLPAQLTQFIGRTTELTELGRLQRASRLVTVTGTGGVGKTRLALEAAAAIRSGFGDGVGFVDLAPLRDAALVAQTVATAVGMPSQAMLAPIDALCAHLADKHMLLLLDNCEHLVEACAVLADALLRSSARLSILATSREPLRVPGEITYRVPPMEPGDAVRLFAERAVAVRPDFNLTDTSAPTVAAIGTQLDGIPLAIELAASRLGGLSLGQLAARLGDRFRLLTTGNRTALPRHRTLRALLDWSHDLLSDQERTLFRRLSVFSGGWSAEAAERVCADPNQARTEPAAMHASSVLPLLLNLVGKSLVAADASGAETRYRLHETIREYALEHLSACDEVADFRQRHARYCLAHVQESAPAAMRETGSVVQLVLGAESESWLKKLRLDYDNMRAALEWTLRERQDLQTGAHLARWLYEYWNLHGLQADAIDWLERALGPAESLLDPQLRVDLLCALSDFASRIGDTEKAEATSAAALALSREHDLHFTWMRALQMRAQFLMQLGLYADVSLAVEEWLALARKLHNARYEGVALAWLGLLSMYQHDFERAAALVEEALRLIPVDDTGALAIAWFHQGMIWAYGGDIPRGMARLGQTLANLRASKWDFGCATVLNAMGHISLLAGNLDGASECFAESLMLFHRRGALQRMPLPLEGMAALAAIEGQAVRATTVWSASNALRAAFRTSVSPMTHARCAALVEAAQSDLAPLNLAAAEAAGRAMSVEQVVAYALAM